MYLPLFAKYSLSGLTNVRLHCNKFYLHCNVLFVFALITPKLYGCSNCSFWFFSLEYADNSKKIQIKMVFGMVGQ